MELILLLQLLSFVFSVFSQLYRCNYDEECPSSYACFGTSCQLKTLFLPCDSSSPSSTCGAGCCSEGYCRDSSQIMCSLSNSCTSSNTCLSLCCSSGKCSFGSSCGNLQEGASCTDSRQCSSQCCYNNRCDPVLDITTCSVENLETSKTHNVVYLSLLGAFDFALLCIIIVLINMYINKTKANKLKNEDLDKNRKPVNYESTDVFYDEKEKGKQKGNIIQKRPKLNPLEMSDQKQFLPKVQIINPPTIKPQMPSIIINKSIPISQPKEGSILQNSTSQMINNPPNKIQNSMIPNRNSMKNSILTDSQPPPIVNRSQKDPFE